MTYMRINSRGKIVLCKKPPRLAGDEVAVKFSVEIPDRLFRRPRIEAVTLLSNLPPEDSTIPAVADFQEQPQ